MLDQSPTRPVPQEHFTIGDWLVEASLDRVSRADAVVHLRPQLTDLLVVLARRAGRTVPKHVILAEVWGSQYVGESALTRCIAEIRQALGDDAKQPTIIQTIPKRGYRLVAPVVFLPLAPPTAACDKGADTVAAARASGHITQGPVATHGSSDDGEAIAVTPHRGETTRGSVVREWLRDTRWHVLLALAVVIALALAAGHCGPRDAAAKHATEKRTGARECPVRHVATEMALLPVRSAAQERTCRWPMPMSSENRAGT